VVKEAAIYTAVAIFVAQTSAAVAGSPSLDMLSQLISALGPMGFVMWLVWRTTNHTIPRLAKGFEDAIERQRIDFKESLKEMREGFFREMDRERETHTRRVDRFADAVEKLAARE